ncbi:MAG: hypothetical protein KBT06_08395 [Prevotellaceae bacterium]|nr:hypothetical protein [Candidatus Colivivens equi]
MNGLYVECVLAMRPDRAAFQHVKGDELELNKLLVKELTLLLKEMALQEGYYLVQSTAKRYVCVEIDINRELDSSQLDPSIKNVPYDTHTERYDSQYSTIGILKQDNAT